MNSVRREMRTRYIFKSRWKRLGAACLDVVGQPLGLRRLRPWRLSGVKRVLLVRMDQLGDVIFSAPAVDYLHDLLPEASIDFLTGPWAASLVKHFPHVSDTHVFDNNWFDPNRKASLCLRNAKAMLQTLRANHYDLGIDLRGDLRTIGLMRAAGISKVLSYGITGGNFMLDRMAAYDFNAHQVDLNLRLIGEVARGLNGNDCVIPTKEQRRPQLVLPQDAQASMRMRGWSSEKHPRILVHAEAGYSSKRWNRDRFEELLANLCAKGRSITLIGLEQDDLCESPSLQRYMYQIRDLRGKTSLLDVCGLIQQADLLIGNDSAPTHIAAGMGKACVVLFSGANEPSRWCPVGEQVHLLYHPVPCSPCEKRDCFRPTHECMDAITVEEVEKVVEEILSAQGCLP